MFPHGANGRVWKGQGAQPVGLGGLEVTQMSNISETHLLLPPFFSLIVEEEAAPYLGTDEKHLHYECMRFIKRAAQRREVQAPTARLQAGGTTSCDNAVPRLPRLLQISIFSFHSRRVETHT